MDGRCASESEDSGKVVMVYDASKLRSCVYPKIDEVKRIDDDRG